MHSSIDRLEADISATVGAHTHCLCLLSRRHRASMKRLWQSLSMVRPISTNDAFSSIQFSERPAISLCTDDTNEPIWIISEPDWPIPDRGSKYDSSTDTVLCNGMRISFPVSIDENSTVGQGNGDSPPSATALLYITADKVPIDLAVVKDLRGSPYYRHAIELPCHEVLACYLATDLERNYPKVAIDVYNTTSSNSSARSDDTRKLVFTSTEQRQLIEAYNRLVCDLIPSRMIRSSPCSGGLIPEYNPSDPRHWIAWIESVHDEIQSTNRHLFEMLHEALDVIDKALGRYGQTGIAFSFNGGKDCTVLMFLYTFALAKYNFHTNSSTPVINGNDSVITVTDETKKILPRLKTVFLIPQNSFRQVEQFAIDAAKKFNLDLISIPYPMKSGLQSFITDNSEIQAILLGTRRTDPFAENLQHFSQTDPGWPQFMRINPIINWKYCDIWTYTEYLQIPHCSLYDRGYTSLGGRDNTLPNPKLADQKSPCGYRQAKYLKNDELERLGRIKI